MFAVVGTWTMDANMRERQVEVLPALVAGVRQNDGFVRGFWTEDVDDSAVSLTFIVFETLEQARAFREVSWPMRQRRPRRVSPAPGCGS